MNGSEKQINGVLECILIELREMAQEMADNSMWYHGFKEMTFQSCIYNALVKKYENKTKLANIPLGWAIQQGYGGEETKIVQLEFPIYKKKRKRADIVILPAADKFVFGEDFALMTIEMKWNDNYGGSVKPDIEKLIGLEKSEFKLFILINSPNNFEKMKTDRTNRSVDFIYIGPRSKENKEIVIFQRLKNESKECVYQKTECTRNI